MITLRTIIVLALLGGAGYLVYRLIACYRESSSREAFRERILAGAKNSMTILIQYLVIIWSALLGLISYLSDNILNLPEVQAWVRVAFEPEIVLGVTAVIAVLTMLARLRSLGT